jgi:hypothetical protein
MHLGERTVVECDAVLGGDDRRLDAPLWKTPISSMIFPPYRTFIRAVMRPLGVGCQ